MEPEKNKQELRSMSQSEPEVGGGGKAMARGQKHLSFCSFISHGQLIPWVYASVSSKFDWKVSLPGPNQLSALETEFWSYKTKNQILTHSDPAKIKPPPGWYLFLPSLTATPITVCTWCIKCHLIEPCALQNKLQTSWPAFNSSSSAFLHHPWTNQASHDSMFPYIILST